MTTATDTHSEYTTLNAFPWHNGYANAHQCYVTITSPVLSIYTLKCLSAGQEIPAFSIIVGACHSLKDTLSNWRADLTITL